MELTTVHIDEWVPYTSQHAVARFSD